MKYILFFFLFIIVFNTYSQDDYNSLYNLKFNILDNRINKWEGETNGRLGAKIDSSDIRLPLQILQIIGWGNRFRFKFNLNLSMSNMLFLPINTTEDAEISFTYRSENLKKIELVISGYDDNDNSLLYSDTLAAPDSYSWNTCKTKVQTRGSRQMLFNIIAAGIDSTYLGDDQITRVDSSSAQNLWLDEIGISVGGKEIGTVLVGEAIPACRVNKEDIIPYNNQTHNDIPLFTENRILGIGETFHGSETFNEIGVQLIKNQVQHNQCKLVLLEIDLEYALSLNRFVQGDESFNADSLLYDLRYYSYSSTQLKDLLLWLKSYNKTAKEKVWLLGFDTNCFGAIRPGLDITTYLYNVCRKYNMSSADTICWQLMHSMYPDENLYDIEQETIQRVIEDKKLHNLLKNSELEVLIHAMETRQRANSMHLFRIIERDIMMYDNAKFLIDLLCHGDEKAIIYGHFGHINYKCGRAGILSCGYYLKKHYKDRYVGIGLLSEAGHIKTNKGYVLIQPLQKPQESGLEHIISTNVNDSCAYVPLDALSESVVRMRYLGDTYLNEQFCLFPIKNSIDGIIFIKESKPATCLPDLLNTRVNAFEASTDRYSKLESKLKQIYD